MKKTVSGLMFPTRILQRHGGPALPKHGGNWQQKILIGWEDMFGLVLIIVVSQHPTSGQISIRISALWICADFQKIFITTIKVGGPIMTYCISHHIGIGEIKEINQ